MTNEIETLQDQLDALKRMGMEGTLKWKDLIKRIDRAKREQESIAIQQNADNGNSLSVL